MNIKKKKTNPDVQKLAKRIKTLRKDQGYSNHEHFAFDHYFARTQYARYEKGEDLRFTSLVKLVHAFGISYRNFLKDLRGGAGGTIIKIGNLGT